MKKLTTEEFINNARAVHGSTYSYENTVYVNNRAKVEVTCFSHGPFYVKPNNHINSKSGCAACSGINKVRENFVERARAIHGERYCYDFVDYQGSTVKVKIECKKHGIFLMLPNNHISVNKSGCPTCAGVKKPTTDEFIKKAQEVHGLRYNYDEVIYVNNDTKVKVICPIDGHGEFLVTPKNHLVNNCPKCSGTKQLTTEEFIEMSTKIHGDHYDYSLVEYTNNAEKVDIICRIHNMKFKQAASSHLKGYTGCRLCDQNGFNYDLPCTVYYLKFECEDRILYKIGITTTRVQTRISGMKVPENIKTTILQETKYENGHLALAKEKEILTKFKEFQYTGNPIMENGNTELFSKDVLGLDK